MKALKTLPVAGRQTGMQAGLTGLKILMLMVVAVVVSGCATTVKLNHTIASTNIVNPEKPDIVFVVKPYEFESPLLNAYGVRTIFTGMRVGDASLCIGKALRNEIPNSAIVFDANDIKQFNSPVVKISVKEIEFGANFKYSSYCKLKVKATKDNKKKEIEGFGSIGILRMIDSGKVYHMACHDIAKQIKSLFGL